MRARCTSSFCGMLYEAASMLRTEGKGRDGRGGTVGLFFGREKREEAAVTVGNSEVDYHLRVNVRV